MLCGLIMLPVTTATQYYDQQLLCWILYWMENTIKRFPVIFINDSTSYCIEQTLITKINNVITNIELAT